MPDPFLHRVYLQLVSRETLDDPDRGVSTRAVHRSTGIALKDIRRTATRASASDLALFALTIAIVRFKLNRPHGLCADTPPMTPKSLNAQALTSDIHVCKSCGANGESQGAEDDVAPALFLSNLPVITGPEWRYSVLRLSPSGMSESGLRQRNSLGRCEMPDTPAGSFAVRSFNLRFTLRGIS